MASETKIHPLAIVEPGARLGVGVSVGPFCTIGAHVELGDHSEVISHVSLAGRTRIGSHARIFPFASIGHIPQDLKYHGEDSTLEIGDHAIMREGVTMNPGTEGGGMATRVGHHCTFLANAHVAHDCIVGNHVIFSNNVMLAGHCQVGDYAILGGGAAVHQFCRIGGGSMTSGNAVITEDIPPNALAHSRNLLSGLNLVGMRRRGLSTLEVTELKKAYHAVYAPGGNCLSLAQSALKSDDYTTDVAREFLNFFLGGKRGRFVQPE